MYVQLCKSESTMGLSAWRVACSVSLSGLGRLLIRGAQSAGEERTKEERSEARKTQELLRGDGSSVEERPCTSPPEGSGMVCHGRSSEHGVAAKLLCLLFVSAQLHFLHADRFRAKKQHDNLLIYGHYLICIIATKPALPARSDAILLWTRAMSSMYVLILILTIMCALWLD
jgi:hypothetical protein